ncbi:carboxymuconolactone decarboxylase family protein [Variovorax sp. YR216]|uniref:carboxymuconolactone decarboxylase family protein n=1 Tax=Variovorax sp. YR216 TaxID=1882828 RepID=UPI00089B4B33|nr:carboxymuconolactone decarboxylase family protein [Variovorax sp. YR216]SEB25966.1 alkylhydroperoxidase AhpD family core domain-containing protein [Variovorax sp. YR216]
MTQRLDHQSIAPEGMRSLGGVYMYVNKSGLPHELIDLVYLRVSQINGCAYCVAAHSRDLLKAGVPPVKLMMLNAWHEADMVFSARERAALQWAESLTRVSETGAPQADYDAMSEYFTERERVDLTLAVGLINTYNRLAIAFRKTPEVAMPG